MSESNGKPPNGKLTKVQHNMLAILKDGEAHHWRELHACLHDDLGPKSNIHPHLNLIRKYIKSKGFGIICEWSRRRCMYRMVKFVSSATTDLINHIMS